MFNILSFLWYTYVTVMFFTLAPEASNSIEDALVLWIVIMIFLSLPEMFRDR